MTEPLVSVSGVRGVIGDSFTEEAVRAWTQAFAVRCLPDQRAGLLRSGDRDPSASPQDEGVRVVLARDTRPSGAWALDGAARVFGAGGVQPVVLGIVPTPTAQLAVTHHRAAGGLVITGSHNPAEWNALKFLGPDGVFLSAEEIAALNRAVILSAREGSARDARRDPSVASLPQDDRLWDHEAISRHVENVLATLLIDAARIRARAFRVVVDPVNGTGALAVPRLLKGLGCDVTVINGEPTGQFAHPPEPTPANLQELGDAVRAAHADLGLAVDPDADRLALVDEKGEALGEEYTVTLAILSCLSSPYHVMASEAPAPRGVRGEAKQSPRRVGLRSLSRAQRGISPRNDESVVVVNLSTTRMVDDVAQRFGARVARTPVGERYVVEGMRAHRAIIGGEGNGGVIFAPSHEGRDSLVGAALVLDLLARRGDTLSQLGAELPRYVMRKEKLLRGEAWDHERLAAAFISEFPEAQLSTLDGVRVDTSDGWVHLRPSNTEPILRLIAEARTEDVLTSLLARVRHVLAVPAVSA